MMVLKSNLCFEDISFSGHIAKESRGKTVLDKCSKLKKSATKSDTNRFLSRSERGGEKMATVGLLKWYIQASSDYHRIAGLNASGRSLKPVLLKTEERGESNGIFVFLAISNSYENQKELMLPGKHTHTSWQTVGLRVILLCVMNCFTAQQHCCEVAWIF